MNSRDGLLSAVAGVLRQSGEVALCGHVMPDGDCLGSMLALGLALKKMGKQVHCLSPDPVPDQYLKMLPGAREIKYQLEDLEPGAVFVCVDCSVPERLGRFRPLLDRCGSIIIIDHHAGGDNFGDIYVNDPGAAAAGELIYALLPLLPVEIDADMAQCLYVAINTDTGSFRYDNVRPQTHRIVARLLETGFPAGLVNKKLYEEKPLASMRVLGEALKTLEVSACGRVSSMYIKRAVLNRLNASDEHVDGVTNYPRMIEGVEVALFFRELEDGRYKVSLRSKHFLDVNKLATRFGGGGHHRAAGCIMEGELADVCHRIKDAALRALEEEGR